MPAPGDERDFDRRSLLLNALKKLVGVEIHAGYGYPIDREFLQ